MKMIEIRPDAFLNMETIVMLEKGWAGDEKENKKEVEGIWITTLSGEQFFIEQKLEELLEIIRAE